MTLTIRLDRNWNSFQLAKGTLPPCVTGSAIAPSTRMHNLARAWHSHAAAWTRDQSPTAARGGCDASTANAWRAAMTRDSEEGGAESPMVECIDSRSKAGCLSRNSAVDDSIGETDGVTDTSVQ